MLTEALLEKINETLEKIHEDLYHISVALNKIADKEEK